MCVQICEQLLFQDWLRSLGQLLGESSVVVAIVHPEAGGAVELFHPVGNLAIGKAGGAIDCAIAFPLHAHHHADVIGY